MARCGGCDAQQGEYDALTVLISQYKGAKVDLESSVTSLGDSKKQLEDAKKYCEDCYSIGGEAVYGKAVDNYIDYISEQVAYLNQRISTLESVIDSLESQQRKAKDNLDECNDEECIPPVVVEEEDNR